MGTYEERARAALQLLQESIRASGVPDVDISLEHDKWGGLYVIVMAEGRSHRLELKAGSGYIRLTRVMQNILANI